MWSQGTGNYLTNPDTRTSPEKTYGNDFSSVYDLLSAQVSGSFQLGIVLYTDSATTGAVISDWNVDLISKSDALMKENIYMVVHNYFLVVRPPRNTH